MFAMQRERFAPRGGKERFETEVLRHSPEEVSERRFVVDDEDGRRRIVRKNGRIGVRREREVDAEDGTVALDVDVALDDERASVTTNNTKNGGKPEPATLEFGRKEGLKDSRKMLIGNAGSVIANTHDKVATSEAITADGGEAERISGHVLDARFDVDDAIFAFKGLGGVKDQI
jgi:hypothetical protein